jgi:hypothetical protein
MRIIIRNAYCLCLTFEELKLLFHIHEIADRNHFGISEKIGVLSTEETPQYSRAPLVLLADYSSATQIPQLLKP